MFSGIKYIFGYADETTNSLKPDGAEAAAQLIAREVTSRNESQETDPKDTMIDHGQNTSTTLLEPQTSTNLPNDDWSCDGSIDLADMDDTWEVIPPPCFTGRVEKLNTEFEGAEPKDESSEFPTIKEAARENALIEHPSFYIASTSDRDVVLPSEKPEAPTIGKPLDFSKRIVLKKKFVKKSVRLDVVPQVLPYELGDASWMSFNENAVDDQKQEVQFQPVSTTMVVAEPLDESKISRESPTKSKRLDKPEGSSYKTLPIKKNASAKGSHLSEKKVEHSSSGARPKSSNEKKAWKNKFVVDDWDLDGQEDIESDFDSMFEPVKKKKPINKAKRQAKQQRQPEKKLNGNDRSERSVCSCPEPTLDCKTCYLCETVVDSPGYIMLPSLSASETSDTLTKIDDPPEGNSDSIEMNDEPIRQDVVSNSCKRLVQVRPIGPERRPGWQLKRQRSKRRPLASSILQNKQQPADRDLSKSSPVKPKGGKPASNGSANSSARTTPTFIDRIGNSIVANITTLTNGLVSSGALNSNSPVNHSPLVENNDKVRPVVNKPNLDGLCNNSARKQLSKNFLNRQNICAQQSNNRRPDRRMKMFSTPNGCSVNRKVHTSIH